MITRTFAILIFFFLIPFIIIASTLIIIFDGKPIFFKQNRVGVNNKIFKLYKFRTMKNNTADVATHLLKKSDSIYTKFGKIYRKFSIDEIPQILNIMKGDLQFIGPRPALYNQDNLIKIRTSYGIHKIIPGVTGWAQVNGRDSLSIPQKVELDKFYMKNKSLNLDLKILLLTVKRVLYGVDVDV